MKSIRILSTRRTIIIAILVASILPVSFLFIAFMFRNDAVLDKPGTVEELAKSVIAIILSISGLLLSNAVSRKEIEKKSIIFREQVKARLIVLNDLLKEVIDAPNLMKKSALKNSSTQIIRANHKNKELFMQLLESLSIELEEIYNSIVSMDPEIGHTCVDYQALLHKGIIAIRDFNKRPSVEKSFDIKQIAQSMLTSNQQK